MKKQIICKKCNLGFDVNFVESGKNICLSSRKFCLNCKPKRKEIPGIIQDQIKINYPLYGVNWCVDKYNITKNQVNFIASKLKLKITAETKSAISSSCHIKNEINYKVCHEQFKNINSEIHAYILGLLWSDGHVSKTKNSIYFITTSPDDKYFVPVFQKTGNWGSSVSFPEKGKARTSLYTNNLYFKSFLEEMNYCNKELGADKIYNAVPDNFKRAFILGVIDGDGCFYINEKTSNYTFSICSSYNQDWGCFENLLRNLKINWKIKRVFSERGSYSKIIISGKSRVSKFGDYIYSNYEKDSLGLLRKYQKFIAIKAKLNKRIFPKTEIFKDQ